MSIQFNFLGSKKPPAASGPRQQLSRQLGKLTRGRPFGRSNPPDLVTGGHQVQFRRTPTPPSYFDRFRVEKVDLTVLKVRGGVWTWVENGAAAYYSPEDSDDVTWSKDPDTGDPLSETDDRLSDALFVTESGSAYLVLSRAETPSLKVRYMTEDPVPAEDETWVELARVEYVAGGDRGRDCILVSYPLGLVTVQPASTVKHGAIRLTTTSGESCDGDVSFGWKRHQSNSDALASLKDADATFKEITVGVSGIYAINLTVEAHVKVGVAMSSAFALVALSGHDAGDHLCSWVLEQRDIEKAGFNMEGEVERILTRNTVTADVFLAAGCALVCQAGVSEGAEIRMIDLAVRLDHEWTGEPEPYNGQLYVMDADGAMITLSVVDGVVSGDYSGIVAGLDPETGAMVSVVFADGLVTNIPDGEGVVFWINNGGGQVTCSVEGGVLKSENQ